MSKEDKTKDWIEHIIGKEVIDYNIEPTLDTEGNVISYDIMIHPKQSLGHIEIPITITSTSELKQNMTKEELEAYNRYFSDWRSRKNNEWHLSKEEFIDKCTIDEDFKQKWFIDSVKYGDGIIEQANKNNSRYKTIPKERLLKLVSDEKTDTINRNKLRIKWRWFIRLKNKIKLFYLTLLDKNE